MSARRCPGCDVDLTPIRIVDQLGQGRTDVGFAYTIADDPKTSAWSGKIKNREGTVHAYLCGTCSRVLLYAEE